jgi:DNA-binding transcriptional MerR regulator
MLTQLDLFGEEPKKQEKYSTPTKVVKYNLAPPTLVVIEPIALPVNLDTSEKASVTIEVEQRKPSGRQAISSFSADITMVNIPDDKILFSKSYYPISEVAIMFNVNISLLRFWEKEFDVLKPRKNRKGDRLFRPEDVKMLKLIYFLLREKKYTIEGAKVFIKKGKKSSQKFEAIESLRQIRLMLLELKAGLSL